MEKNELSARAAGGTEQMLSRLHNSLPKDLLDKFQIIPSRVRDLNPNKKKIFWAHDLHADPEAQFLKDQNKRDQFDKLVFVSDWQLQMYNAFLGVPYRESVVIQNAIEPIEIPQGAKDSDKIRLIYHTTPHRGLEILVPVFEELYKIHPEIELDVYSSFSVYGWSQRDEQYKSIFDRCRAHPAIRYHGGVSNAVVREALARSHIFAYPCIWPETSCIALIEAMSAGNIVVCPNYAALPETAAKWAVMYQWSEDLNEHANKFAHTLNSVLWGYKGQKVANNNPDLAAQRHYYNNFYNWDNVKFKWDDLLNSLA